MESVFIVDGAKSQGGIFFFFFFFLAGGLVGWAERLARFSADRLREIRRN